MLSTALAQFENSYILEHFPVTYSASFMLSKGRSSNVIQPISCELQSQWLQSLESVPENHLL